MAKNSFIYYFDWAEETLKLPDDLRLKVDDAVKRYVLFNEEPTDREVLYSMFSIMRKQIDKDKAKYEHVCELRKENGAKGGKQKAVNLANASKSKQNLANASKSKQNLANLADNDNDNDNDNIKETTIVAKKDGLSLTHKQDVLEKNKEEFKENIKPYLEKYDKDLLNDFFQYWTEPNKSRTRMRFQLEKTWDIGRRLARWARNQK